MPVTLDDMDRHDPLDSAFQAYGISAHRLVREGKKQLQAKDSVFLKIRKAHERGRNVAETSVEAIVAVKVPNNAVRQKQVQDFHRLMGHYPAERVKLNVGDDLGVDVTQYSPEERAAYEQAARLAEDLIAKAIIEKRTAAIREADGARTRGE